MKMHSGKNLVLCYYFKYFILFPQETISSPGEKYKFHLTTAVLLEITQNII